MLKRGLLGLLFVSCFAFGQKQDTLRLFYSINQSQLENNASRIDSLIKSLKGTFADVQIIGYADYLWNNDYNLTLSKQRAENVKNYISEKHSRQITIVSCEGKGELKSPNENNADGNYFHRRVDIIYKTKVLVSISDEGPVVKKPVEQKPIKKDINQLNVGESVSVEGLSFEPGRHIIMKESSEALHKLLTVLQNSQTLKIEIQGHVCCTDNGADGMDLDTHQQKLSENRAKFVYDYLVKKGIDASRLSYKGYGRKQPKVEIETTPEEEQMNRRVEIKILEK